jgi:ribosome biogenesis GTPase
VRGLVVTVHGKFLKILVEGREIRASMAGKTHTGESPSAGDIVEVKLCDTDGCSTVEEIMPRRNSLRRPFPGGVQVIAANIDLAVIVVGVRNPPLRRGFIDRNAASAISGGIPVAVVVNKIDLAGPEDADLLDTLEKDCGMAGIGFFRISCLTGEGLDVLAEGLRGRIVVLTGPSGAGKTSLVKALGGPVDLRTGGLNARTGKGTHTTVAATLVQLPGDVMLVDTPGLRAFPVSHIPPGSMQMCFPEFVRFHDGCRFRDCLHRDEPGCAVKQAVSDGRLSAERYSSYLQLLEEVSGG